MAWVGYKTRHVVLATQRLAFLNCLVSPDIEALMTLHSDSSDDDLMRALF